MSENYYCDARNRKRINVMLENEILAGQETDDVLNINIDDLFKDPEESLPQEDTSNAEDSKSKAEPSQMTKHMTDRINEVRRKTEADTQDKIAKELGYASYAEMQKEKEQNIIREQGYDPEDIERLVEPLLEKRLANDPRFKRLEEIEQKEKEDYLKEQLEKINKVSDVKYSSVNDLPQDTIELWSKGVDLHKAYLATAGEELLSKRTNVSNNGSLPHLADTSSNRTSGGKVRALTEDEKNFYRSIMPYVTEEELAKKTVSID